MSINQMKDRMYREAFRNAERHVEQLRATQGLTVEGLEELLHTAYVNQGNNWLGRGAVHEVSLSATIAAYEQTLERWRKEPGAGESGAGADDHARGPDG